MEKKEKIQVSIPFRADTGFELGKMRQPQQKLRIVSIPFRADTGFEPGFGLCVSGLERDCFNPFQG